jgi:hypothetical protein
MGNFEEDQELSQNNLSIFSDLATTGRIYPGKSPFRKFSLVTVQIGAIDSNSSLTPSGIDRSPWPHLAAFAVLLHMLWLR